MLAAVLTCTLTIALSAYAWTTKTDFTIYGGILCTLGWALFAISILLCFVNFSNQQTYRNVDVLMSVCAIAVYGAYLIYDTQLIMGGKRFQLTLDDYVLGALVIYIDIVVLFVRILRIIGEARRR